LGAADFVRNFPWARAFKFGAVGASGVLVNYGVYVPFTRLAGVAPELSYVPALLVSILTNFLLNEAWTFRDRREGGREGSARRLGQFYLVSFAGAAINYGVYWVAFRKLGIHDLIAILIGIAIATAWNFFLNLFWTWRKKEA
jgi:dolichol-phosphate mannosyltransferase